MKRVAVLGSNGQLGLTLKSIAENDPNEFVFFSKGGLNITNKKALKDILGKNSFNYCVNCAAYTNVEEAETNSNLAFSVNAEGVKNIAEVCRSHKIKLIHISTDYVFDGKKKTPYKADDTPNPINEYGKSKLKGELYIRDILNSYYIIRTSWLYSVFGKNFLKTIIGKIKENTSLKITTTEKGTPTSCIDLSKFILHLINRDMDAFGTYNFSAKGSTTWYGYAKEIEKQIFKSNSGLILPTDSFKTIAKRPKYSVLDLTKTDKIFRGINQWEISVKDAIDKLKK